MQDKTYIVRLKRKKGMSLIEALVTMIVLMMLVGALFWMLLAGKSIWQASIDRSSDRQDLQIASHKVELELRDTDFNKIATTFNSGVTQQAFAFASAYDDNGKFMTDSTGATIWQRNDSKYKYVIYYVYEPANAPKKLMRKEILRDNNTNLTTSELTAQINSSGTIISNAVLSMNLEKIAATTDNPQASVLLTLSVQKLNKNGKYDRQMLEKITIIPRNTTKAGG